MAEAYSERQRGRPLRQASSTTEMLEAQLAFFGAAGQTDDPETSEESDEEVADGLEEVEESLSRPSMAGPPSEPTPSAGEDSPHTPGELGADHSDGASTKNTSSSGSSRPIGENSSKRQVDSAESGSMRLSDQGEEATGASSAGNQMHNEAAPEAGRDSSQSTEPEHSAWSRSSASSASSAAAPGSTVSSPSSPSPAGAASATQSSSSPSSAPSSSSSSSLAQSAPSSSSSSLARSRGGSAASLPPSSLPASASAAAALALSRRGSASPSSRGSPPSPSPGSFSSDSSALLESSSRRYVRGPRFVNLDSCGNCRAELGLVMGRARHHCRNCGNSFCGPCSLRRARVPYRSLLDKGPQRVCDPCFSKIAEFHRQLKSDQFTWDGPSPRIGASFQQAFRLDEDQEPKFVFSCAYFPTYAPVYGKLYLTQSHLCFEGYEGKTMTVMYTDVRTITQPNLYFITALEIITESDEKYFYAAFEGTRDDCYTRIEQLMSARKQRLKRHQAEEGRLDVGTLKRRASQRMTTQIRGFLETEKKLSAKEASEMLEEAIAEAATAPSLPPPDASVAQMQTMLDAELPVSVSSLFSGLWSNENLDFYCQFLVAQGDKDTEVGAWRPTSEASAAEVAELAPERWQWSKERFSFFRRVFSKHPPKVKFPGLSSFAEVSRLQQCMLLGPAGAEDRLLIAELTSFSGIPYSDYFSVETRWVASRDSRSCSHLEVGLMVNFHKSTWFKSQIMASTSSESKEVFELWHKMAMKRASSLPTPPPPTANGPASAQATLLRGKKRLSSIQSQESGEQEEEEAAARRSEGQAEEEEAQGIVHESAMAGGESLAPKPHTPSRDSATAATAASAGPSLLSSLSSVLSAGQAKLAELQWPAERWLSLLLAVLCLFLLLFQLRLQAELREVRHALSLLAAGAGPGAGGGGGAGAGTGPGEWLWEAPRITASEVQAILEAVLQSKVCGAS